ncbi:MAG: hypothetical protein Q9171_004093 [Xanthocarpia ochracea]
MPPTHPDRHILARIPPWISHWLGYRPHHPPPEPPYAIYLWSFIGAFCGLSALQAIFGQISYFIDRGVPPILASYGASAVLCYSAIQAPLAQPRALVVGHFISAVSAVCIVKLFSLLPPSKFQSLEWLIGSLSTAIAIVIMQATKTTHPPAGATALLAAVDKDVRDMGWYLLPVILLSSVVMLVTALLFNNVQRRFPVFWVGPAVPPVAEASEALGGGDVDSGEKEDVPRVVGSRSSSMTLGHVAEERDRGEV